MRNRDEGVNVRAVVEDRNEAVSKKELVVTFLAGNNRWLLEKWVVRGALIMLHALIAQSQTNSHSPPSLIQHIYAF